jgi:hypothetical protein
MPDKTPQPQFAGRSKRFTAAELQGHCISITNPNILTWNTALIDVPSGYKIENACAFTVHGSLRAHQEVDELTAIITLIQFDPDKCSIDPHISGISYEDVTVDVHSIVTREVNASEVKEVQE